MSSLQVQPAVDGCVGTVNDEDPPIGGLRKTLREEKNEEKENAMDSNHDARIPRKCSSYKKTESPRVTSGEITS
jgi:hypothetical protein